MKRVPGHGPYGSRHTPCAVCGVCRFANIAKTAHGVCLLRGLPTCERLPFLPACLRLCAGPAGRLAGARRTAIVLATDRPTELWKRFSAVVVWAARRATTRKTRQRLSTVAVSRLRQSRTWDARKRFSTVVVGTAAWNGGAARAFQRLVQGAEAGPGGAALPEAQQKQRSQAIEQSAHGKDSQSIGGFDLHQRRLLGITIA